MAGEPAKAAPGILDKPVNNSNRVHEAIKQIQAAKATGKFTFQAGRADRALNLFIGVAMCFTLFNVGRGVHQLANGYGRKEGF